MLQRDLLYCHRRGGRRGDLPPHQGDRRQGHARSRSGEFGKTVIAFVEDPNGYKVELIQLLLPLLIVVPLAFAAVWLALRSGLAPLNQWRARLAERSARDRSPVPSGELQSELVPIAASLDALLARLAAAVEAERSFAANAAHAAGRAITQAQRLQVETADPAAQARAAEIEAALKRLQRVSERLMQLARVEGARRRRDEVAEPHREAPRL